MRRRALGNGHDVAMLQEHQPPCAVVVGERAERLGPQRDLRVELQRCVEQRQRQYTPHMPSIEISSISSSSSIAVSSLGAVDASRRVSSFSMAAIVLLIVASWPPARAARVGDPVDADLFPELAVERDHLSFARRCRDSMIQRFRAVDPSASADEITSEYVEVTVAEALEDLHSPGAGDFFGRITDEHADRWYIGRRHIEDDAHDPVVVDWRAPIAAPFYRATGVDPLGLSHRRRFTMVEGDLSAYLDEQLDDPDSVTATAFLIPCLPRSARRARVRSARSSPRSRPNRTWSSGRRSISASSCREAREPARRRSGCTVRRSCCSSIVVASRATGVLVVGPNTVFLDYIANVLPSLGERLVQQRTALDICVPKVEITGTDDDDTRRWKGAPEMLDRLTEASVGHVSGPTEDLRLPIGARTLEISAR